MSENLTVKCLKTLKEKGLNVKKLTMDNDTTTFARAKKAISEDLKKSSDKNHVAKNLSNSLFRIRESNRNFTIKTINYFKKCFSYAIQQNKGNEEAIRSNMEAIVPHAFGNHSKCNEKWCGFLKNPVTYAHKSLPYGKDLQGDDLQKSLSEIFDKYARNADNLADLDSTNVNENLNNVIAHKAPKAQHYSGSDSLTYRVSAAVAQKNVGHEYILKVCI